MQNSRKKDEMKISEIVRVDGQKSTIEALKSKAVSAAMNLHGFERQRSDVFKVPASTFYTDYELASKVYESALILGELRESLKDPKAQARRAINELLKWYKGLI